MNEAPSEALSSCDVRPQTDNAAGIILSYILGGFTPGDLLFYKCTYYCYYFSRVCVDAACCFLFSLVTCATSILGLSTLVLSFTSSPPFAS